MKKIIVLKDGRGYKKGEIAVVNPNEAHSLIDGGFAKLYFGKKTKPVYENKMMTSRRPKWRS